MTTSTALMYRIGTGKAIGLIIGLLGFFLLPALVDSVSLELRLGVLFWYSTMGAIIGVFGVYARHPVISMPLPWWVRGTIVGAWMNLVLTLIAHQQIGVISASMFGEYSFFANPYLLVVEGALIGLLMDGLLTRFFGDGFMDLETQPDVVAGNA